MKTNSAFFTLFFVAFIMAAATTNAQVRFGIKGEVGANKITLDDNVLKESNYNSYKIGPAVEFMIPKLKLGLEGAILYSNDRTTVKEHSTSGTILPIDKAEVHYLDIPVNLKFKFFSTNIFGAYLSGGPYAHFNLGKNDFFEEFKDNIKAETFGAGINLGAGIELFSMVAVGAGYSIKLSDNYSSQKPEWDEAFNGKKGTWSVTASVYF